MALDGDSWGLPLGAAFMRARYRPRAGTNDPSGCTPDARSGLLDAADEEHAAHPLGGQIGVA